MRFKRIMQIQLAIVAAATSASADTKVDESKLPNELVPLHCVFFEYNKADVQAEFADEIGEIASWSKSHPNAMIVVDGHTDPAGSMQYNTALGGRRALAVKNALVTFGVDPGRIVVSSYGENPQQAGTGDDQHARRVTITATEMSREALAQKAKNREVATIAFGKEPAATKADDTEDKAL